MKLTMMEMATYFDIPYYVVYRAMRGKKAYSKHNQKFDIDDARKRIIDCLDQQKARAMEKMENCDGMICRVQAAGGNQDGAKL